VLARANWLVGGSDLQRLTIFAAQPGSAVVVQAEYFEPAESPAPGAMQLVRPSEHAPPGGVGPTPSGSSYPLRLYASTQRGLGAPRVALLDVHA
jgi:hypothetical protein